MPNFVKISQTVAKILRFFRFFKMAAAAILNCRIRKILLADGVRTAPIRITVPNFIKISLFAEILQFLNFQKWPTPPS